MLDFVDPATLTRLGLVLNFAAAFLLAPDLLGVERIRRLDQLLTSSFDITEPLYRKLEVKLPSSFYDSTVVRRLCIVLGSIFLSCLAYMINDGVSRLLLVASISLFVVALAVCCLWLYSIQIEDEYRELVFGVLTAIFLGIPIVLTTTFFVWALAVESNWVSARVMFFVILVSAVLAPVSVVLENISTRKKPNADWGFVGFLALPFIFVVFVPSIFAICAVLAPILAMVETFHLLFRFAVVSQGRTRNLLVLLGIGMFIAGTMAQFWATFLPPT